MRRLIVLWTAFVAMTGTVLVLPVYAAPAPAPVPVDTSTDDVAMGSVADPAPAADVARGLSEPVSGVPSSAPTLTVQKTGVDPFSMVGVTWKYDAGVTDTVVQVRVQKSDGSWGDWSTLEMEAEQQRDPAAAARGGTSPVWTGTSTGVEAELVTRSGAQPVDVQLDLVDPGRSASDSALGQPAITDTAHAASAMPPIYSRAQWGADERIRTWAPQYAPTIKAATIHHTADSNNYTADQVPAILRAIYQYHAVDRGWGDIGYNVIADKFGRLWEGRYGGLASTVIGAHAGGFNYETFGVSMLGDYSLVAPPAALINAVANVIAWKFALYKVNPNASVTLTSAGGAGTTSRWPDGTKVTLPTIFGHRDVGNTTCPGDYGYARLGDIRELVTKRMSGFSAPVLGNIEDFSVRAQTVSLRGWAYDPKQPTNPIHVTVTVNGTQKPDLLANLPRNDVAAVHPEAGANHGFSTTLTIPEGDQLVCVRLEALAPETLPSITCKVLTGINPDRLLEPIGSVDAVAVDGRTITARGWTYDLDTPTAPLSVHLYINGSYAAAYPADRPRTDVGRVHPEAGNNHGYEFTRPITGPGSYQVCIFAINQNGGSRNPQLGCRTVTSAVADWSPAGSLDTATVSGRAVTTSGWAFDLDAPAQALSIHRYVDGGYLGAFPANVPRADVGRIYPAAGNTHGYTNTTDMSPGKHSVCTYAINTGPGANSRLGCATVTVAAAAWNPWGNFDGVSVSGATVLVGGWAIDADTWTTPIRVSFTVDGRSAGTVTAGRSRGDLTRVYPKAGAAHGFGAYLRLAPGSHRVCAIGLNAGQGSGNTQVGCHTITVR